MYALKEISTGYYLHQNGVTFGQYDPEQDLESNNIMEGSVQELEPIRDSFNAEQPGRVAIGASPKPH